MTVNELIRLLGEFPAEDRECRVWFFGAVECDEVVAISRGEVGPNGGMRRVAMLHPGVVFVAPTPAGTDDQGDELADELADDQGDDQPGREAA